MAAATQIQSFATTTSTAGTFRQAPRDINGGIVSPGADASLVLRSPIALQTLELRTVVRLIEALDEMMRAALAGNARTLDRYTREVEDTISGQSGLASLAVWHVQRLAFPPGAEGSSLRGAAVQALRSRLRTTLEDAHGRGAISAPSLDPTRLAPPQAGQAAAPRRPLLSAREMQVARLVALGQSNKQIAIELHLSPNTIKRHIARILRRLGLGKRSAMATWYVLQDRDGDGQRIDAASLKPRPASAGHMPTTRPFHA